MRIKDIANWVLGTGTWVCWGEVIGTCSGGVQVYKNGVGRDEDSSFEQTGFSDADYAGCKDTFKSTSEGDIRFLEELLIDDSILSHESFDFNFEENQLIPQPLLERLDTETNAGEEIPVVMNDKDKDVD
nr:hypothetical protein [Tanacetum cinerariifolium]